MIEGLDRLVELQRLDSQLIEFEEEFGAVPGRREKIAQSRTQGDERLEASRQVITAAEMDQRQAEADLQDQETLLARLEGQQNQVKSNQAYTVLLQEMDQARQAISLAETRILEAMESLESGREKLAEAEEQGAAERKRLAVEEEVLDAREQELGGRIAALTEGRESACGGLEAKMLAHYQKILNRRRPALVMVTGEMCTGCRVGIPAQDFIDILKSEQLITCGNCQRILFHADNVAGTAAPAPTS